MTFWLFLILIILIVWALYLSEEPEPEYQRLGPPAIDEHLKKTGIYPNARARKYLARTKVLEKEVIQGIDMAQCDKGCAQKDCPRV